MTQFVPSTSLEVSGPWLLSLESLKQLDEIIIEEWKRLHSDLQTSFDQEVEEEYEKDIKEGYYADKTEEEQESIKARIKRRLSLRYEFEEEKSIEIYFSSGEKLIADSFENASREQVIVDKNPIGFKIFIRSGEIRCRLDLSPRDGSLDLNVSPRGSRSASELFVSLRRWVVQNRAPLWQRKWTDWSGWQWAILPTVIMILIFSSGFQSNPSQNEAKQEAFSLIENGFSQTDVIKAIELLLIFESNYNSSPSKTIFSPWVIVFLIFFLIISIFLSIRPKVVIGLGKGVDYLSYWNNWLRFVGVTIPSLIFFSFVWPYIVNLINSFFR